MLWVLIEKEWKSVLLQPKFALTFAASAVLLVAGLALGVRETTSFADRQAAARALLAEEQREATSAHGLGTRVFRDADPATAVATGVHADVGRFAEVRATEDARLRRSPYSEEPILALFRTFDPAFVVTVVLSLFAILFTYDAVNGEREAGTLRLVLAGAVPRAHFVLAKLVGTWLGLALPLLLPALLGALVLVLARVPLGGEGWIRLGLFALAATLYLTVFVAAGVAASAWTRRSATSFLLLLVLWVATVLVIPRAGLLTAVAAVPVPSAAELESRRSAGERRAWDEHADRLRGRWASRQAELGAIPEAERDAAEEARLWRWLEEDDEDRKETEASIARDAARLAEEVGNRRREQERLALALTRVSPAAAFQLAAMESAATDVGLKDRYEEAARAYRTDFTAWAETQGGGSGRRVVVGRRGGGWNPAGGDGAKKPLDLSGMPAFEPPRVALAESVRGALPGIAILGVEALLAFAVGFVGFLRYDVR